MAVNLLFPSSATLTRSEPCCDGARIADLGIYSRAHRLCREFPDHEPRTRISPLTLTSHDHVYAFIPYPFSSRPRAASHEHGHAFLDNAHDHVHDLHPLSFVPYLVRPGATNTTDDHGKPGFLLLPILVEAVPEHLFNCLGSPLFATLRADRASGHLKIGS